MNPEKNTTYPKRRDALKAVGVFGALAAGVPSTAAAHDGDGHILTIVGRGDTVTYVFSVTEGIEKTNARGASINSYDAVDGTKVSGRTTEEPDSYEFTGIIESFEASGPVDLYIDGVRIDQATASDAPIEENVVADLEEQADEPAEEEPEPEEEDDDAAADESDYEHVVDIVAAGGDNTGSESILPTFRSVAADDTLIKFPPGEYLVDGAVRFTEYDNFGLVGSDATLVCDHGEATIFKLGTYREPHGSLHIEGFTCDITRSGAGGRVFELHATDSLYAGDITIEGQHDTPNGGPLLVGLQDRSGDGEVVNYSAADGGAEVSGGYGGTGLLVSNYHEGALTITDAQIGPWPDNGIYCSNGTPPSHQGGTVHVEGGLIKNCNVAGVRLAGVGSTLSGTRFVYDEEIPGFDGMRPIRVDWGRDLEISDVEIEMDVSITEAIRVLEGVDSLTITDVTMSLSDRVRDAISILTDRDAVDISGLIAEGMSRYEVFDY